MLIAWSGGLDSSLALKYSLNFWRDRTQTWNWGQGPYEHKHGAPRTFVLECTQCSQSQQKMQLKARNKMRKSFKYKTDDIVLKLDTGGHYGTNDGGNAQAIMWITQAAALIKNDEPLMMGWLGSDSNTYGSLFRIKRIWNELCELNKRKNCPLWLPLLENTKSGVITSCRTEKIFDMCWWCEDPVKDGRTFKQCGTCGPCLNMITAEVRNHKHATKENRDMNYDEYLEWLLDGEVAIPPKPGQEEIQEAD